MDSEKDYSLFLVKLVIDSLVILISWFAAYFLRFYVIPGGKGEPLQYFCPDGCFGARVVSLFPQPQQAVSSEFEYELAD